MDRHFSSRALAEHAQVVKAEDMIRVRVRHQYRIDLMNFRPQSLRAKIGRGIHEQALALVLNVNRRSQAMVVGIVRAADGAVAPDHRDAMACAGAQKSDAHRCIIGEPRIAVKSPAQWIMKWRTYHWLGGFQPCNWIKNLP